MNDGSMSLLAISGSLRKKSSNSILLHAMVAMVPPNVKVTMYEGLAQLPHFNPDLDMDEAPVEIVRWRKYLSDTNGVLICTPEYAKGVPGSLKNALDWIVSSGELVHKPVAVVSASPHPLGGEAAHVSLLGTLSMMNADVVEGGTLKIPYISLKLGAHAGITDEATKMQAQNLVHSLVSAMDAHKSLT